jgi:hypothetical protein
MKEKKSNNFASNARHLHAQLVSESITAILSSKLILATKTLIITVQLVQHFSRLSGNFMKHRSPK